MKKIKIGVLSTASIAIRFLIPAIKKNTSFELYGIASRDSERAKQISEEFGTHYYDSYENLINSNVDAIYIPLPNSLHYEWIKKSLDKNLNVLVEKSMTCSLVETTELNEIAESKNLVLIENFQFRFHSQLDFIKSILHSGEIGELRNIRSSFGFPPFKDEGNIRYQSALGGGALLDAGAYPLKVTQLFLGENVYVASACLGFKDDKEVDIWGSAFVKQKNSSISSQIAFGFDHYYQNTFELWGSKGKVTANRIFTAGPGINPEIIVETQKGIERHLLPEDNHFINMLDHFAECILTKQNLREEYKQNINQSRLLGELYERAK